VSISVITDVLEKFMSRQIPATLDNARQASIVDIYRVPHSAFSAKLESHA
jgi:hypothetical protein